jgi:DNA polymerase III sliding clamp (beta) subunit (PCNA family)
MISLTLPVPTFKRMVRAIAPAASRDECRPILTGICLEVARDRVRLAATDSYRLHVLELHEDDAMPHSGIGVALIPAEWLTRIARIKMPVVGEVRLEVADKRVSVKLPEGENAGVSLISGEYPNIDSLISTPETVAEAAFNPSVLLAGIKACSDWDGSKSHYERPMRVVTLDALKPCRFEQAHSDGKLTVLVLPVRVA